MKKLCLLLAVVLLLLCGCNTEAEDSGSRRRSKRDETEGEQTAETVSVGRMGSAIYDGENIYYWQYDSSTYEEGALMGFFADRMPATLICMDKDGQTQELISTTTADIFVLAGRGLYYVDGDQIYHLDLETMDTKLLTAGSLVDVDEVGEHLIIELDGYYHSYSIADDQFTSLFSEGSYEGYYNGVVYYGTEPEDYKLSQKGQVNLNAVNIDGTDARLLVTTQPDLYNYSGVSNAAIEQLRFSEDALYFSYGSIGGSGGFFQGGKVMRVPFDGSEPQVVAGEDDLVNADFGIAEDGTVVIHENAGTIFYSGHTQYYESQEGLFWMDRHSGMTEKLLSNAEYEGLVSCQEAFVTLCDAWDDVAILTVNYTDIDPTQNMGWRDYYARVKTVTYKLENGVLTELYSF